MAGGIEERVPVNFGQVPFIEAVMEHLPAHPTGDIPLGRFYFNTSSNLPFVLTDTGWVPLTAQGWYTGPQGPAGPTGPRGFAGPQGDTGPTGADGLVGPTGAEGLMGPSGADGLQGATGADGLMGPTGPAPDLGSLTYTNAGATPATVGGIPAGSTFDSKNMQDMWDSLLYPYQNPGFSSFSISGQPTTLEVGATSNADPSFTWADTNTGNILADSIQIMDTTAGVALVTDHSNTPPAAVTQVGVTRTSAGSQVYTIIGTNTKSATFSRTFSINWQWKAFYGEAATTPLVAADIQALRVGGLKSGFAGTYSFSAAPSQFKYICYPVSFGTASSFKDQSTNLVVPFEDPYVVSITNGNGIVSDYRVHRSVNMIGGALTVVVS